MRILLLEDDANTAAYVSKGLEEEGHTVDHLADGRDAVAQAVGETYDVVFDAVGKLSHSKVKHSIAKTGKFLNVLTDSTMTVSAADLEFVLAQIEAGKLKTVIDRTYPLEQIVEAHRYVDAGHKKGNVVVTVASA